MRSDAARKLSYCTANNASYLSLMYEELITSVEHTIRLTYANGVELSGDRTRFAERGPPLRYGSYVPEH